MREMACDERVYWIIERERLKLSSLTWTEVNAYYLMLQPIIDDNG